MWHITQHLGKILYSLIWQYSPFHLECLLPQCFLQEALVPSNERKNIYIRMYISTCIHMKYIFIFIRYIYIFKANLDSLLMIIVSKLSFLGNIQETYLFFLKDIFLKIFLLKFLMSSYACIPFKFRASRVFT